MDDKSLNSPCINICELNDQDVCIGCYRTITEIAHWNQYGDLQKKEVYLASRERQLLRGRSGHTPEARFRQGSREVS